MLKCVSACKDVVDSNTRPNSDTRHNRYRPPSRGRNAKDAIKRTLARFAVLMTSPRTTPGLVKSVVTTSPAVSP